MGSVRFEGDFPSEASLLGSSGAGGEATYETSPFNGSHSRRTSTYSQISVDAPGLATAFPRDSGHGPRLEPTHLLIPDVSLFGFHDAGAAASPTTPPLDKEDLLESLRMAAPFSPASGTGKAGPSHGAVFEAAGPWDRLWQPVAASLGHKSMLYVLTYGGMGAALAAPGPALVALAERAGASLSTVSYLFPARAAAYLLGAAGGGPFMDMLSERRGHLPLALSIFTAAFGTGALAFSFSAATLAMSASLQGVAIGAADTCAHVLVVRDVPEHSVQWTHAMHVAYAAGALVAPLAVEAMLTRHYAVGTAFLLLALLLLPLGVASVIMRAPRIRQKPSPPPEASELVAFTPMHPGLVSARDVKREEAEGAAQEEEEEEEDEAAVVDSSRAELLAHRPGQAPSWGVTSSPATGQPLAEGTARPRSRRNSLVLVAGLASGSICRRKDHPGHGPMASPCCPDHSGMGMGSASPAALAWAGQVTPPPPMMPEELASGRRSARGTGPASFLPSIKTDGLGDIELAVIGQGEESPAGLATWRSPRPRPDSPCQAMGPCINRDMGPILPLEGPAPFDRGNVPHLFMLGASCMMAGLSVGAELAAGGFLFAWAALGPALMHESDARALLSAFWASVTVGRVVSVLATRWLSPTVLLAINFGGAMLAQAPVLFFPSSHLACWISTIAYGFCLSSSFPNTLAIVQINIELTGRLASALVVSAASGELIAPLILAATFTTGGGSSSGGDTSSSLANPSSAASGIIEPISRLGALSYVLLAAFFALGGVLSLVVFRIFARREKIARSKSHMRHAHQLPAPSQSYLVDTAQATGHV
ncbi:hypothetical protein H696_03820 [Fonticula alba]|uniref:Uncharacterized protein n=1 Tax=Fonticula alba TaxID=691883 RepID=A0A058Z535_FONAL|nr:hypothetical protein H696_03820 [Fonticula alba]KCV69389.1 hypothetical protein H696_03820 [Fonticula alba]|eukprot:XP_009495954.1 hypothetical protein H696_03820 [Fonticula alba]